MKDPIFEIGMEIEAELKPSLDELRWQYNSSSGLLYDCGYSGEYIIGRVTEISVDGSYVAVEFKINGYICSYGVPLLGHDSYRKDQFLMPGYPSPARNSSNIHRNEVRCCCGSWVTYGKDCKFHSDWCDVKKRYA